ncbi:MAG: 2-hydroxyacid dehydrogenase [bacterium]
MKVSVFDIHRFERPYLESALGNHELRFHETRLSPATAELARGADALVVFVNDQVSEEVLQALAAQGLRFVATRSAGFNHIDLQAAKRFGLRVANVPDYSPHAVAEHTVALMLALNRKLIRSHHRIQEQNFSLDGLVGFDMAGKTVGVVGLGRIGRVLAKILDGFGCRVLGYDLKPPAEAGAWEFCADLETVFRASDILSLHVPLTPQTRYLIRRETIAWMKPGVMLVNTSRGALVKTKDVIKALKSGHIGYLGIDVYEEEEGLFFEDHSEDVLRDDVIARLMTFPNVLITSHQAFLTREALTRIAETTAKNLECFEQGLECPNALA